MKKQWRDYRAALATFVLAISLIGLGSAFTENYLRSHVFDPTQFYVRFPGWEIVFHPSAEGTPGVTEDAHIRINSLGLRGREPNSRSSPTILAIGGSTTEDIVLNDADTWAGRLELGLQRCHPDAWVGNSGKAGTNSRHHLLALEKTLPRLPHPDRVVELVGLNDMLFDAGLHYPPNLPDTWWTQQTFDYAPPDHASLIQRSAIYQAMRRMGTAIHYVAEGKAESLRVVDWGTEELRYKKRWRHVNQEDWVTEPPDLSRELENYRSALNKTVDLVTRSGSRISFATQPSIWKPHMDAEERSRLYAGGVGDTDQWFKNPHNKWFTTGVMATLLSAYNRVTLDVCKERGLVCIDLASELPKSAAVFYDDFHFSKAGAAEVARIVSRGLPERCQLTSQQDRAESGAH